MITLILILFLILFLILARVTPPCSYRQPDGNGQLLSRRYLNRKDKTFKKGAKKKSFSAMYHYVHDANTTQKRALTR